MSYYNSPLDSIYSQIKEIYSILSKQQTTIWEEDPIKGSKLLLHDIKGMLNGTITSTIDFGGHSNIDNDSLKIIKDLYVNGFEIKNESMDDIYTRGKISKYAARKSDISYLEKIIRAVLDNDCGAVENEANEYAKYYCEKRMTPLVGTTVSPHEEHSTENSDGDFNLITIVEDISKNGVKISPDSIDTLTQYITSNPRLANAENIMKIINIIVFQVLGKEKEKAFRKRLLGYKQK